MTQRDTVAQELVYQQAVEDVRENRIDVDTHAQELQSLQLQERKDEVPIVLTSLCACLCAYLCVVAFFCIFVIVFGVDQILGVVQFRDISTLHM